MVLDMAQRWIRKMYSYIKTDGKWLYFIASTYFVLDITRLFKWYSLCFGFQCLCYKQIVMDNIFDKTYRLIG